MTRRRLIAYIGRRLGALAVLLIVISFTVFSLLYLAPGSPEQVLLGTRPSTPAATRAIRAEYHLDEPFLLRYGHWAVAAAHLDLGRSIRTNEPVLAGIESRFGVTAKLGSFAFVLTMLLGVPLGAVAAVKRGTVVDRAAVGIGVAGVSAPAYATGVLFLYVFAVRLNWFPVFGQGSGFVGSLWHLTLPAFALALTAIGLVLKLTRAGMIAALEQDYIVFARARGLSRRRVLLRYALRNSLVPIITAGGLVLAYMLVGAVLVEATFALPGVGSLLVDAVTGKDLPMVQGLALLAAIVVVTVNLCVDLLYLLVDPRIARQQMPS